MKFFVKPLLALFFLAFWSCNPSAEPNPLLVGQWTWDASSGGLAGARFNPKPTERLVLSFGADKRFSLTRNDTLLFDGTYAMTTANSIYSGKEADKIVTQTGTVNPSVKNNQPIVIGGIITTLTNQELSIGDNHFDGYGSSFTRKP